MRITILTIFPELFRPFVETSLVGRARRKGLLEVHIDDIRAHAIDRHKSVDDTPYGGGAGMVMRPDVLARAVQAAEATKGQAHRVFLTPQGRLFDQTKAVELAQHDHLMLICGRYEGVDERFRRRYVHEEISVGDYVVSGGEIPAMLVVEAVSRLLPGVMGNEHSAGEESFGLGGLEYPQYTRPRVFENEAVPEVLLSGDHKAISSYRRQAALERTAQRRPDLLEKMNPTPQERTWLSERFGWTPTASDRRERLAALASRTHVALLHHPVYDRSRRVVTTAVTNLDVHDIARASRTYGLAGYHVVTPIALQRQLVHRIQEHWTKGHGAKANPPRRKALELLSVHESLEELQASVARESGSEPVLVATTARSGPWKRIVSSRLASWPQLVGRPLILLFGTGWGLSDDLLHKVQFCLEPIEGLDGYNHLSVRSAVSVYLDRIFGPRRSLDEETSHE